MISGVGRGYLHFVTFTWIFLLKTIKILHTWQYEERFHEITWTSFWYCFFESFAKKLMLLQIRWRVPSSLWSFGHSRRKEESCQFSELWFVSSRWLNLTTTKYFLQEMMCAGDNGKDACQVKSIVNDKSLTAFFQLHLVYFLYLSFRKETSTSKFITN